MACFSSKTLVFFLLLFPFSPSLAQLTTNIPLGASLSASDTSSPWLSPSAHFAFGFLKLNTSDHLFLLCIWFAKLSDHTIVWFARSQLSSSPAATPGGSKLTVTSDQGLVLTDPQGREVWKTTSLLGTVSSASMTDTGNFLLRDSSSDTLWQSFDFPTDTVLPSQSLERGDSLSSRRSQTNFTTGRFQLLLQQDGNLVLSTVNLPSIYQNQAYFSTGTGESSPGTKLVFNETSGLLYVLRENGTTVSIGTGDSPSPTDYYLRATLEFDGVLVLYSHPKSGNGSGWTVLWSKPDDICRVLVVSGLGVCGYNSICRLKQNEPRPYCNCPERYSLVDPTDSYGDCKPDFVRGCEEDGLISPNDLYDVEVLINIDWPTSDYMLLKPSTADLCRESCLKDCMCSVAIFRDETCWKKKLPLSNGHVDTSLNSKAFLKLRKAEYSMFVPNRTEPVMINRKAKDREGQILIGSVLLGTSMLVNVLFVAPVCIWFFFVYRKKKTPSMAEKNGYFEMNLRCFDYKELENATGKFSEELGRGAFGVVYKGTLKIGSGLAVAVKKLNNVAPETVKEFTNEANVIGQTHHKNLVRLLGYCDAGENRLLVYEYMSNGTLASYIFGDMKPSWKQRMETALGVAKGLLYLHEECATHIIHCDIKPQNILLDEYGNPKISDFGLAKLLMMDQSRTNTAIRGTKGYVAPEWFRNVPVTAKVDVYSFGVVLLEMICCRRSVESENAGKEILTDWAYDCFSEGALDVLVSWEAEAMEERENVERSVRVSLWCIQENPSLRPTMREVVQMLEGVVQVHVPPCPFPYST